MKHGFILAGRSGLRLRARRAPSPPAHQLPSVVKTPGGQEMVLIPAGEFMMGSRPRANPTRRRP